MLAGQKMGPFLIERELGSGAMGTVYRANYIKTGQRVAVKVMAPGLCDNERAQARFEREGEILKQLKHPHIVRLFGVGKSHGTPYYAMEYIEGESLDRAMDRRDRLTWEELVTLGKQLCDALYYAHQKGIIHRDLKPSNLMILKDGTVKLTDFGIAKDVDVTQLTSANCTVGTAAYMSPEQCRGERNLTFKSDLYSLGVVFFELLVGKKPFSAENAMDMFLKHVNEKPERPSRLVMDIPVWLDTLVCQLLEKRPEHRPRDAEMVGQVLASIAEKFAAQKSAGEEAVRKREADRLPGSARPDAEDKDAARLLAEGRFKVKRRKKVKPLAQRKWFQAVGLLIVLLVAVGLLIWAFLPPGADKLYAQAAALMQAGDLDSQVEARDKPIAQFLVQFPNDPRWNQVLEWSDKVDDKLLDKRLESVLRRGKPFDDSTPAEKKASLAVLCEEFGDPLTAYVHWKTVKEHFPDTGADRPWVRRAGQKVTELADKVHDKKVEEERLEWANLKLAEADQLGADNKKEQAKSLYSRIFNLYKDDPNKDLVEVAKKAEERRKSP
jgi:serine/threonine-protein kinase